MNYFPFGIKVKNCAFDKDFSCPLPYLLLMKICDGWLLSENRKPQIYCMSRCAFANKYTHKFSKIPALKFKEVLSKIDGY